MVLAQRGRDRERRLGRGKRVLVVRQRKEHKAQAELVGLVVLGELLEPWECGLAVWTELRMAHTPGILSQRLIKGQRPQWPIRYQINVGLELHTSCRCSLAKDKARRLARDWKLRERRGRRHEQRRDGEEKRPHSVERRNKNEGSRALGSWSNGSD
jgi:hypothetical protein